MNSPSSAAKSTPSADSFVSVGLTRSVEELISLAAQILQAEFVSVFSRRADAPGLVLSVWSSAGEDRPIDTKTLEARWQRPTAVQDEADSGYLRIKGEPVQAVLPDDDFARAHAFTHTYLFPRFSGDRVETVLIAYWDHQPQLDVKHADASIGSLMNVLDHLKKSTDDLAGLRELMNRYSRLVSSTCLLLDERKFDETVTLVAERLADLVPETCICMLREDENTGMIQASDCINIGELQPGWVEWLTDQLKSLPAGQGGDKATPPVWHELPTRAERSDPAGLVSVLCCQSKFRTWCVIWKAEGEGFSPVDRELLNTFAVRAGDILENASVIAGWKRANRLLMKASQRFADNETLAALVDMTSGLAHDFNNIIGAAIGRTQLMKLRLKDKTFLRDVEKIESLLLEGAHTVRRIQEFSTSARYKGLKKTDLVEVVNQYTASSNQTWRVLADEKKIAVDVQVLVDQALVEGVASDIGKAMEKLIHNAVEHSADGVAVDVILADRGKYFTLSIANRGPVISEELRKKIFYPFFTTKPDPGAGLGLAVAHGIVIRHAGKIVVHSTEESGTIFEVALPKLDPTTEDSEITNKTADIPELRVLVVDDDEQIREVLADMLMVNGHKVTTCCDGYSALETFKKDTFDLLITDLGMAGMSGLDLAGLIHEENPDLPIAMITGWGSQLNHDEVALKGIKAVLAKPFHLKDINALVEQLSTT